MLFTLFDQRTETFSPVMTFRTEEEAKYTLANVIAFEPNNLLAKTPDSFVLYSVGDFEIKTGIVSAWEPLRIFNGFELLQLSRQIYQQHIKNRKFIEKGEEDESRNDCSDCSENIVNS